jgi:hypothetical protein
MNFINEKLFLSLFLAIFFTLPSYGNVKSFKVGNDQFKVDVPQGWQTPIDFYGFPVSLMGPENAEKHRTFIGIIPSGEADTDHVFDSGNKDVKGYISGREKWLEQFNGKSISYDPYQKTNWEGIEEAHVLGYHYELPTGKFYERSLYILCSGRRLYHVKSLVLSPYEKTDNAIVENTIRSLKCEKITAKAESSSKK